MRLRITIQGRAYEATVEDLGAESDHGAPIPAPAQPLRAPHEPPEARALAPAPGRGAGEVLAPLPGVVTEVKCRAGQAVAAGQVLLLIEAMKMDNEITAGESGTVREVRVARGDQVAPGQVLVVLG